MDSVVGVSEFRGAFLAPYYKGILLFGPLVGGCGAGLWPLKLKFPTLSRSWKSGPINIKNLATV